MNELEDILIFQDNYIKAVDKLGTTREVDINLDGRQDNLAYNLFGDVELSYFLAIVSDNRDYEVEFGIKSLQV
jgi:hypothetical protein